MMLLSKGSLEVSPDNTRRLMNRGIVLRWLKRAVIGALVTLLVLLVAITLGYSRIAAYALTRGVEMAGLEGQLEVSGGLFSHLEVRNVSTKGSGIVRRLNCDFVRLDYSLVPLISSRGKEGIELVSLKGVSVTLVDDQSEESSERHGEAAQGESIRISEYLGYLKHTEIDASEIDVS